MSLIEIARFRLASNEAKPPSKPFLADAPYDQYTATLRFNLSHGIRALSKSAKHPFHLLQGLEDPLTIYYIGKWPSLEAYGAFRESKDRAELIDALEKSKAVLEWSGFYDILHYEKWESTVVSTFLHREKGLMAANVIGITLCDVAPEDRAAFEGLLANGMPPMERYSGHKGASGWKLKTAFDAQESADKLLERSISPLEHRDQIVILGGWSSQERYDDFRDTEEYMEYVKMRSVTKWFGRDTAKVIRLE